MTPDGSEQHGTTPNPGSIATDTRVLSQKFVDEVSPRSGRKRVVRRKIEWSAVLPQIHALEPKGNLAVVNPQRRMGCAALMPEYLFELVLDLPGELEISRTLEDAA